MSKPTKETGYNFVDFWHMQHDLSKTRKLPVGLIKVSYFGIYISHWIVDDKKRKSDAYSVLVDDSSKVLLLKPDDKGKYQFTRKKSWGIIPKMLRSKKLIELFFPDENALNIPKIFECKWNDEYKGFLIDFNKEITDDGRK